MKKKENLIVFAKYPNQATVKTRLISAVGAYTATQIHSIMTEYTLDTLRKIRDIRQVGLILGFSGCSQESMSEWLGEGIGYVKQPEGDLGYRMTYFFQRYCSGNQRTIIVGTDCPELTLDIICDAFDSLANYDIVIGPAYDGGYYLIGMSTFIPNIFTGISWGTASVLEKTISILEQLDFSYYLTKQLHDVDRPEDLSIFNRYLKKDLDY